MCYMVQMAHDGAKRWVRDVFNELFFPFINMKLPFHYEFNDK